MCFYCLIEPDALNGNNRIKSGCAMISGVPTSIHVRINSDSEQSRLLVAAFIIASNLSSTFIFSWLETFTKSPPYTFFVFIFFRELFLFPLGSLLPKESGLSLLFWLIFLPCSMKAVLFRPIFDLGMPWISRFLPLIFFEFHVS